MVRGSRIAAALARRAQIARHRGTAVMCPLCGSHFARFKDARHRANALCWRCGSHERHRAQWLLFEQRPALLGEAASLLHFAPEWGLRHRLERLDHPRYVTADLHQPDVDLQLDLTHLELPDASFDAVICSHVLEHIPDDAAAMGELRRITAPTGWCLVMVPLDPDLDSTYEDPSITTPDERRRAFGQADHVRFYAPDVTRRLAAAGFEVEVILPRQAFGDRLTRQCRIPDADQIFLCRPEAAPSSSASP